MLSHLDIALARQRFARQEQVGRAVPFVFVVVTCHLPWLHRQGKPRFTNELFAHLIHTDLRAALIIRADVDCQYILHLTDKFGIVLWRDAPLLA